jgi:hypothetical protein
MTYVNLNSPNNVSGVSQRCIKDIFRHENKKIETLEIGVEYLCFERGFNTLGIKLMLQI